MNYPKHTQGQECEGCNERMKEAHVMLQSFFSQLKDKYNDVHVSCVYRNKEDQDKAFLLGGSKLRYPHSKHNKVPSEAIDIFQINENGKAIFNREFLAMAFDFSKEIGLDLRWGGKFKSLGDFCHYELRKVSK